MTSATNPSRAIIAKAVSTSTCPRSDARRVRIPGHSILSVAVLESVPAYSGMPMTLIEYGEVTVTEYGWPAVVDPLQLMPIASEPALAFAAAVAFPQGSDVRLTTAARAPTRAASVTIR